MTFRATAVGYFVTYANGVTEELSLKDYKQMLRRQMRTKMVKG